MVFTIMHKALRTLCISLSARFAQSANSSQRDEHSPLGNVNFAFAKLMKNARIFHRAFSTIRATHEFVSLRRAFTLCEC